MYRCKHTCTCNNYRLNNLFFMSVLGLNEQALCLIERCENATFTKVKLLLFMGCSPFSPNRYILGGILHVPWVH